MLNIAKNVISTRWAFKVKSDRRCEARKIILGWRQKHRPDCGTKFVCRFDLLVIACKDSQYSICSNCPAKLVPE